MTAPVLTPSTAAISRRVLAPNVWHAGAGIWRLTARRFFSPMHWLAVAGGLAVLGLLAFAACSGPRAAGFLPWAAGFYVCFLVPTVAFVAAGGALREDLKSETVDFVFTRPIPRPAFIAFRFLAHLVCMQLEFLLALGVVLAVGIACGAAGASDAWPWLLLGQALVIVTFTALGFFCALLTSRYVILGLLYGGIIEAGVGSVPTQLSRFSMLHQVHRVLTAHLQIGVPRADASIPGMFALLLGAAVVILAITALLFARRELASGGAREA